MSWDSEGKFLLKETN